MGSNKASGPRKRAVLAGNSPLTRAARPNYSGFRCGNEKTPPCGTFPCSCSSHSPAAPKPPEEIVANRPKVPGTLRLSVRERKETASGSKRFRAAERTVEWAAAETAIVSCDMWDDHYCKSSAQRVGVMVPRMNEVVTHARSHGVMVIHRPSDTLTMYADTPHRKRMQQAKPSQPPFDIGKWCNREPDREPELPVDVSKCSCDDPVVGAVVRKYSRQHPGLDITGYDGISDSGPEVFNFCRQEGIKNVAVMGVHTNMSWERI